MDLFRRLLQPDEWSSKKNLDENESAWNLQRAERCEDVSTRIISLVTPAYLGQ